MNLQSILTPIADFLQWSFRTLLLPMTHWFNWVCIVFAFLAIGYWLTRQRNYTRKAIKEGTTV